MSRDMKWVPKGVVPAVLLPFHEDLSIDEPSFRAHLRDVAAVEGLSAITINAHSTEVASCSFEEQKRVLAITKDEIGDRLPIVHGVYAEGSLEAARIAKMAAPGRCSSSRPGRSPWASARRWRSSIFAASPERRTCRSSPSSTRLQAARAIPSRRS